MRHLLVILFLWNLLAAGNIKFSGKSRLESFYTDKVNYGYRQDSQYLRWNFYGNMDFYGLPFRLNLFLTTEKNNGQLNRYSLGLNIYKLRRHLPWLQPINRFNFGTVSPDYSILTLNFLRLQGIDFQWSSRFFHVAITAGQLRTTNFLQQVSSKKNTRILQHYELGIGKPQKSHVHFRLMHVKDYGDATEVPRQENIILAEDTFLELWQKKLSLKAEAAIALHTRNLESNKIPKEELPATLPGFLTPRISTSYDWATNFEANFCHKNTSISGNVRRIGPGYITLGNPMLFRDRISYNTRVRQRFFNRKLFVSIYGKHSYDNLVPWKEADTKITNLGIQAGLQFRNTTNFTLNYSPHIMTKQYTEIFRNQTQLFSTIIGHQYSIFGFFNTSRLYLALQKADSDFPNSKFNSHTVSLNQTIKILNQLMLNGHITWHRLKRQGKAINRIDHHIYINYRYKNKYLQRIGWRYKTDDNSGQKLGLFIESAGKIPVLGNLKLKVEKNYFQDQRYFASPDFGQFMTTLTLERQI